jgi:hypothetical protein
MPHFSLLIFFLILTQSGKEGKETVPFTDDSYDRTHTHTLRQLYRMFKDERKNVHDEELSARPSVVCDVFVQSEGRRFTISELSCEFPNLRD